MAVGCILNLTLIKVKKENLIMKKILALTFALVLCLGMFVACGINGDKAAENLKAAGYTVHELTGDEATKYASYSGIEGKVTKVIIAASSDNKDYTTIIVFENTDDAKVYFEKLDEDNEKIKEEYEKRLETLDESSMEYKEIKKMINNPKWGRDGAVVYWGTKAAVKAAK